MADRLQRLINLISKTGDKLVVFDREQPDVPYVIVSLDAYEKLAAGQGNIKSLTEDELIDKINRDIALWKDGRSQAGLSEPREEAFPDSEPAAPVAENQPRTPRRGSWTIPESRRREAEKAGEKSGQYPEENQF